MSKRKTFSQLIFLIKLFAEFLVTAITTTVAEVVANCCWLATRPITTTTTTATVFSSIFSSIYLRSTITKWARRNQGWFAGIGQRRSQGKGEEDSRSSRSSIELAPPRRQRDNNNNKNKHSCPNDKQETNKGWREKPLLNLPLNHISASAAFVLLCLLLYLSQQLLCSTSFPSSTSLPKQINP